MHQEHNIPWNTLASNLQFVRDNPHYTPRRTGLFARHLPTQANELNHFVRTFTSTIAAFSKTERAKYPDSFACPAAGKLFTDELRDRHPEFLDERNQSIEYWINCAKVTNPASYSTNHGSLADVIKVLMNENQLSVLLMLAHHPDIPLSHLHRLSWGHHFGFSRVAESALDAYLFFNLAAATGTLENGSYQESDRYRGLLSLLTESMDYNAQQLPHRAFFANSFSGNHYRDRGSGHLPTVHNDLPRLQKYLKDLFVLLYRFDVVMREAGLDPEWEAEILHSLQFTLGQRAKTVVTVVDQEWKVSFA